MSRTTIVLLSHQTPPEVEKMRLTWERLNPDAAVRIAYGGTEAAFRRLENPSSATFIADPRLRTRDHQRERQSYRGVMRDVADALGGSGTRRVLLVECDVAPLRAGLVDYLERREAEERADVLGVGLRRADGTSHPHFLAHQFHPKFPEWLAASVREEKETVLMMLGCLSWWTWEAFTATARAPEPLPVYLELAMPTTAHHLGFRVRGLPEFDADIQPTGEMESRLSAMRAAGRWLAHPCKRIWRPDNAAPL